MTASATPTASATLTPTPGLPATPVEGNDAATSFPDESGKLWTKVGNAQVDTTQSVFGGASALFDGAGDGLYTADSPDFDFGSSDFTIDFRFRPADISGAKMLYGQQNDGEHSPIMIRQVDSSLYLYTSLTGTSWDIAGRVIATGLSANSWYHFALTRSAGSWKIFLNGVQSDSFSSSGSLFDSSIPLRIGRDDLGNFPYNGWID